MFFITALPRPALFLVLGLLAACGDDSSTPTETSPTPQAFPAQLDRTDTLAGLDHNLNGIRDDIEQWINQHPLLAPAALQALLRYAHLLQQTVLSSTPTADRALELARQQARAQSCLYHQPDLRPQAAAWTKRLRQLTANTEARVRAHLAYSAALDGQSWSLPPPENCDAE